MDESFPKCMLLLRLTQSRSHTGSFYVKDVTDQTISAVSDALGLDDIQAFQIILLCSHTSRSMYNCCIVSANMCLELKWMNLQPNHHMYIIPGLWINRYVWLVLLIFKRLQLIWQSDLWQVNKQRGVSVGWAKRGGVAFAPGAKHQMRFTNNTLLALLSQSANRYIHVCLVLYVSEFLTSLVAAVMQHCIYFWNNIPVWNTWMALVDIACLALVNMNYWMPGDHAWVKTIDLVWLIYVILLCGA